MKNYLMLHLVMRDDRVPVATDQVLQEQRSTASD